MFMRSFEMTTSDDWDGWMSVIESETKMVGSSYIPTTVAHKHMKEENVYVYERKWITDCRM